MARDNTTMDNTECQESENEDTMLSEPVVPPLDGYPNVHEFDDLMKRYRLPFLPSTSVDQV
jgi:hypothetical protein